MRTLTTVSTLLAAAFFSVSTAEAACTGSNGRGWGSGSGGSGKYQMTAADKNCRIGFPNFINDKAKTSIPATNVKITRAPKSGKVAVTGSGLIYTPASGFKGNDRFCTTNTTPKVKGQMLRGCITVTVK